MVCLRNSKLASVAEAERRREMAGDGGQVMEGLGVYDEDFGFTLGWWGTRRARGMFC